MGTRGTTTRKVKSRPASAPGRAAKSIELSNEMGERISRKAYELWEQRGRQEGNALRDWLDAEKVVVAETSEAGG